MGSDVLRELGKRRGGWQRGVLAGVEVRRRNALLHLKDKRARLLEVRRQSAALLQVGGGGEVDEDRGDGDGVGKGGESGGKEESEVWRKKRGWRGKGKGKKGSGGVLPSLPHSSSLLSHLPAAEWLVSPPVDLCSFLLLSRPHGMDCLVVGKGGRAKVLGRDGGVVWEGWSAVMEGKDGGCGGGGGGGEGCVMSGVWVKDEGRRGRGRVVVVDVLCWNGTWRLDLPARVRLPLGIAALEDVGVDVEGGGGGMGGGVGGERGEKGLRLTYSPLWLDSCVASLNSALQVVGGIEWEEEGWKGGWGGVIFAHPDSQVPEGTTPLWVRWSPRRNTAKHSTIILQQPFPTVFMAREAIQVQGIMTPTPSSHSSTPSHTSTPPPPSPPPDTSTPTLATRSAASTVVASGGGGEEEDEEEVEKVGSRGVFPRLVEVQYTSAAFESTPLEEEGEVDGSKSVKAVELRATLENGRILGNAPSYRSVPDSITFAIFKSSDAPTFEDLCALLPPKTAMSPTHHPAVSSPPHSPTLASSSAASHPYPTSPPHPSPHTSSYTPPPIVEHPSPDPSAAPGDGIAATIAHFKSLKLSK